MYKSKLEIEKAVSFSFGVKLASNKSSRILPSENDVSACLSLFT